MGGFDMINSGDGDNPSALEQFLNNDEARLVITVGLSGGLTSYNALDTLLKLANQCNGDLTVYVRHTDGQHQIFHPKAYLFRAGNGTETLIVGSNNLSRHGLGQNEEASLELSSEKASEAIDKAKEEMFEAIENDDGEGGPSRLLTIELLQSLKDSGYVCKEGSKSWRKKKKNSKSGNGLFIGGAVGGDLPSFGSGIPEILEDEAAEEETEDNELSEDEVAEDETEVEDESTEEETEDELELVTAPVNWGSNEYPVPEHNGIRFIKSLNLYELTPGSHELKLPNRNVNPEPQYQNLGLANTEDFFQIGGDNVDLYYYQITDDGESEIALQNRPPPYISEGSSGVGTRWGLSPAIWSSNISEAEGGIIIIDRIEPNQGDRTRFEFRFVSAEYSSHWLEMMNRRMRGNPGTPYAFIDSGEVVELPDDD